MRKYKKALSLVAVLAMTAVALIMGGKPALAETFPDGIDGGGVHVPVMLHITTASSSYAYVAKGEKLSLNFTLDGASIPADSVTITATGPDGYTLTCGPITVGNSCAVVSTPAAKDGVWRILIENSNPTGSGMNLSPWDISVLNSTNQEVKGRVFANAWHLNQGGSTNYANLSFYALGQTGYLYKARYPKYSGHDSIIAYSNIGVHKIGSCESAYTSYFKYGPSTGLNFQNEPANADIYTTSASGCGLNYRIYLSQPASDMPQSTTLWSTGSPTWVLPPPPASKIQITNIALKRAGDINYPAKGQITFNTNNYGDKVFVDIVPNGNKDFTDPKTVTLSLNASATGSNSISFDGKDATGAAIKAGNISVRVRIDTPGEIHMMMSDVEDSPGGIEVTRLTGSTTQLMAIKWDDSQLKARTCNMPTYSLQPANWVNSAGGVHGWSADGCDINATPEATTLANTAWGDVRIIENWTYDFSAANEAVIVIDLAPPKVPNTGTLALSNLRSAVSNLAIPTALALLAFGILVGRKIANDYHRKIRF